MKTSIKNPFILPALIAGLGLMLTGRATAQTFTTLYCFGTNFSNGNNPNGLTLSGNTLYGTTSGGGNPGGGGGLGTMFKLNTDGSGFTNLYSFVFNFNGDYDGYNPVGSLVLSGNTLYGTAGHGNTAYWGTVFAVNTDGTDHTNLHAFTEGTDGGTPVAGLILSGNTLYGMTPYGGSSGNGTVFKINTDGSSYTNYLHDFTDGANNASGFYTNSDGAQPAAGLILSGNMLYGTTYIGGGSGNGTIFAVNTNGTGFTNLYNFTATSGPFEYVGGPSGTNSDGANPSAALIISGNTLYGTAEYGGSSGVGTVFKVNTDGTGFTTLYNFTNWSDGAYPQASLILSGNTLYGTAAQYRIGSSGVFGTVFAINTDGTGFTTLHRFNAGDGFSPQAPVILSGITLYGTTAAGGSASYGTVFALSLVPSLGITAAGNQVVLSWPTWAPNFVLQTTTNLASPVWTAVSPAPVVVNAQNVVTNSVFGTQQFYRLSQ